MILGFCPNEQRWCDFDTETRTWYVTPRIFSDLQRACLEDPQWAEKHVMPETGPGPIRLVVGRRADS